MGNNISGDERPREFIPVLRKCERLQARVEEFYKTASDLSEKYRGRKPQGEYISTKKIVNDFHKQARTVCVKFYYMMEETRKDPEIWLERLVRTFRNGYAVSYQIANILCLNSQWNVWPNFFELWKLARSIRFEVNQLEFLTKMAEVDERERHRRYTVRIPYIEGFELRREFGADLTMKLDEMKRSILTNRDILKLKERFTTVSSKLNKIVEIHEDLVEHYGYVDLEAIEIRNKPLLKELHDQSYDTYKELCSLYFVINDNQSLYPKKIKDAVETAGGLCIDTVDKCCDFVVTEDPPTITVLNKEMEKLDVLAKLLAKYAELLATASRSKKETTKKQVVPSPLPTSTNDSKPKPKARKESEELDWEDRDTYRHPYKRKMDIGSVDMEKQIILLEKKLRFFDDFLDRYGPKRTGNEFETETDRLESDMPVTGSRTQASRSVEWMASMILKKTDNIQRGWASLDYRTNFHFLDSQGEVYKLIEKGRTKLLDLRIALVTVKNPKLNFKKFKKFVQNQYFLIETLRCSIAKITLEEPQTE